MNNRILPLLIVMLLAATYAQGQWRQTAGPAGANLGSVVADDSMLVAMIGQKGIYHYNGTSWNHVGDSLIRPELLIDDVILGWTTGTGTVMRVNYRSTDYGITWQRLDVPGTITGTTGRLYSIEVDTLFTSTDNGITWSVLGSIPIFSNSLVSHKGELFANNGFGNLLIKSSDGGKSWAEVQCNGENAPCTVGRLMSAPDALYSYSGSTVMKSTNGGSSWENMNQGLSEWEQLEWMITENGTLWTGGFSGIFRHDGTRWVKADISTIGIQPAIWKNNFVVASPEGLFTIPAGSMKGERLPGDLLHSSISTMESHNGAIFAGANTGVFRTLDQGATWEKIFDGIWPAQFVSDGASTIWMVADDLYRSTDNGATWTAMASRFPEYQNPVFTDLAIAEDGTLFASAGSTFGEHGQTNWTSGGVYRSTDNGDTWREISGNLPFDGINHIPSYNIWTDGSMLMIVTGQGIFRSPDGGATWGRANSGIPSERLEYFSGSLMELGNALYIFNYNDLYRSTNRGASWETVQRPEGFLSYGGASPSMVDGKIYAPFYQDAGGGKWNYRTYTFDGTTWTEITNTIPEGVVFTSFTRAGDFIFGGSVQDAVWKMAAPVLSSVGTDATNNHDVVMESMPNPFNGESRLRVQLPSRSHATITLVNTVGEEILRLHDGMLDAGEHTYLLHGDNLPSGIYFIRTHTDGNATTHMLMKIAR